MFAIIDILLGAKRTVFFHMMACGGMIFKKNLILKNNFSYVFVT